MSSRRAQGVRAGGGAYGVEVYTRVTLYLFVLLEPFFYLYAVAALSETDAPAPGPGASVALVLLALAHMLVCLATVHAGFEGRPVTDRRSRPLATALLLSTGAVVVTAAVTLPGNDAAGPLADPRALVIAVCLAATVGALAVTLTFRQVVQVGLVVPVVVVAASLGGGGVEAAPTVAAVLATYAFTLFWAGTIRMSMWIVEVVRELDAAREVSARLAVAEERLRIARDMHDVVGRALSAVAVKSELAAALARRGAPRGADEMDEVRALAQESLREVRGVVAGYRGADLATELDGARSVLRAAGVAVRVVGEVPHLAAPQVEALAWVVREGVTNIVRHSDARECRIDLTDGTRSDGVRELALTVSNDGARPDPAAPGGPRVGGAGLVGLRERLAAVGGSLDAGTRGDRFVLTARVPAPGPDDPTRAAAA
ncbi:histidine kinase [Isoptericola sp. 4D.3]|uniref:Histidine kinase n=1 Tax=Isoptericola peretonis TaxID=2918523 RepID=A0ABT0J713_9MICO|nr:histidine kinase [Isoptericola sp. 4D.3]